MAASVAATKVAAIFGAGGGLGWSIAQAFASAGYDVAVSRRNSEALQSSISGEVSPAIASKLHAFPCDVTDQDKVKATFCEIEAQLGKPHVVVINQGVYSAVGEKLAFLHAFSDAGTFTKKAFADISKEDFDEAISSNLWGAFTVAQEATKQMTERGSGTIIVTGATASMRGGSEFSLLSMPKAAMRSMAQSMARELGPKGVHVAHVVVDGVVSGPRTAEWGIPKQNMMNPDAMAAEYVHLAQQDKSAGPMSWIYGHSMKSGDRAPWEADCAVR